MIMMTSSVLERVSDIRPGIFVTRKFRRKHFINKIVTVALTTELELLQTPVLLSIMVATVGTRNDVLRLECVELKHDISSIVVIVDVSFATVQSVYKAWPIGTVSQSVMCGSRLTKNIPCLVRAPRS